MSPYELTSSLVSVIPRSGGFPCGNAADISEFPGAQSLCGEPQSAIQRMAQQSLARPERWNKQLTPPSQNQRDNLAAHGAPY